MSKDFLVTSAILLKAHLPAPVTPWFLVYLRFVLFLFFGPIMIPNVLCLFPYADWQKGYSGFYILLIFYLLLGFYRTHGFILSVEDLSPNIGVLW